MVPRQRWPSPSDAGPRRFSRGHPENHSLAPPEGRGDCRAGSDVITVDFVWNSLRGPRGHQIPADPTDPLLLAQEPVGCNRQSSPEAWPQGSCWCEWVYNQSPQCLHNPHRPPPWSLQPPLKFPRLLNRNSRLQSSLYPLPGSLVPSPIPASKCLLHSARFSGDFWPPSVKTKPSLPPAPSHSLFLCPLGHATTSTHRSPICLAYCLSPPRKEKPARLGLFFLLYCFVPCSTLCLAQQATLEDPQAWEAGSAPPPAPLSDGLWFHRRK